MTQPAEQGVSPFWDSVGKSCCLGEASPERVKAAKESISVDVRSMNVEGRMVE